MSGIRKDIEYFEVGMDLIKGTLIESINELADRHGGIHKLAASYEANSRSSVLASYLFCGVVGMEIQMLLRGVRRGHYPEAEIYFRNLVDPSSIHTPVSVTSLLNGAFSERYVMQIFEKLAERTAKKDEPFQLLPPDKARDYTGCFW